MSFINNSHHRLFFLTYTGYAIQKFETKQLNQNIAVWKKSLTKKLLKLLDKTSCNYIYIDCINHKNEEPANYNAQFVIQDIWDIAESIRQARLIFIYFLISIINNYFGLFRNQIRIGTEIIVKYR